MRMQRGWRTVAAGALGGLMAMAAQVAASPYVFADTVPAASTGSVNIQSEDVFLLPTNSSLQVLERISLKNSTSQPLKVQIPLPDGATDVAVQNVPKDTAQLGSKAVSISLSPGTTSAVVNFSLSFSDQTAVQLSLHTDYNVSLAHIYVPIGNAALSAPDLMPDTQMTTIGGTEYRIFTHGSIPAGSDWTMSLSLLPNVTPTQATAGLPVIGTDSQSSASTLQAIGNLAVAALILAVALVGIRKSTSRRNPGGSVAQEEALLRGWEQVEAAFSVGLLNKAEYELRRSSLKERIVSLRLGNRTRG